MRWQQEQLDKTQESLKGMTQDRDWWRDEAMRLQAIVLRDRLGLDPKPLTGYKASSHKASSGATAAASTAAAAAAEADQEDQGEQGEWDSDLVWQEAIAAGEETTKDGKSKD